MRTIMDHPVVILKFVSLLLSLDTLVAGICNSSPENWQSRIGILISPIISWKKIREVEIYWNHVNFEPGDIIALYEEPPARNVEPIYAVEPNASSGIRKTGFQADFLPSSTLTFHKECQKYHVAWLRGGDIKETNCLRTQPTWMQERKNALGPRRMSKVFLPGTHNSASYSLHNKAGVENLIEKHAVTQDIDVLSQLIHGARYLDIRIGHYPLSEETWWTNHGIYRSVSLKTVIDQVKTFLDNTEEIVIFDIQEFPIGFANNASIHDELVLYLEEEFGNYLLPQAYGWTSTLNDIWSSGKRLIIGYDDGRIVAKSESVWPCVKHQWGNVRNIKDLYNYLNEIETHTTTNRITPRSAMAELTPNTLDVILNRLGSLRQMAHRVNFNVTNWYSTQWQFSANIVAVDFLRDTGIVETAIESNDRRNSNCQH